MDGARGKRIWASRAGAVPGDTRQAAQTAQTERRAILGGRWAQWLATGWPCSPTCDGSWPRLAVRIVSRWRRRLSGRTAYM